MESKVTIADYKHDPISGRIELHLRTEYTEGTATWHGDVKQYSCDAQTLRDRFNDSLEDFEAWAAREHKLVEAFHPDIVKDLHERKGKVIG